MAKLGLWMALLGLGCNTVLADNTADFITAQTDRAPALIAPYQAEVAQLAEKARQNAQAPDIQAYIQSLKQSALTTATPSPAQASNPPDTPGQMYIFVSSSLPKASLTQWMAQAQHIGAPLVVRGLIHNSVPDTQAWVSSLMSEDKPQGGVQIDPPLFERFGITQVPAVVVVAPCLSPDCTPDFDVVSGNVSLAQALRTLANKGDANPLFAKQQLSLLRGDHA